MLENVNLDRTLSREQYKRCMPGLQRRLYDLEKACWDQGIPSMLVFEGWDAAGKGTTIATLTQRLDPRGFRLHATTLPRTSEQSRPWLWRFWLRVPNRGEMVIFDHSWYGRVLEKRVEKMIPTVQWKAAYRDIADFERMLADDGTVIVKFFLHISMKEQRRRFERLEANPLERWRVTKEDWARHRRYDDYLEATEEMMELTESEYAPWTIVEATSKWFARRKVFETTISTLESRLGENAPPRHESLEAELEDADLRQAMDEIEEDPKPKRKKH